MVFCPLAAIVVSKRLYTWTRDLHLYFGLFLSPFVLLFCLSVLFVDHAWRPGPVKPVPIRREIPSIEIPPGLEASSGAERVRLVRPLIDRAGISGEVGFINYDKQERRMMVPVAQPGRNTNIEIDFAKRSAKVTDRTTGIWDGLIYLHKIPGPHLVAIRKNWLPTRLWGYFADASVYLLFFLSISGIYLWLIIRSERRVGLLLLGAGLLTCGATLYALCR
jgi:hypothetical protein